MITYLMVFDLRITYVKGCKNVVPDCLSRIFTDAPDYIKNKNAPTPIQEADDFLFGVTVKLLISAYFTGELTQRDPQEEGP